MRLCPFAPPLKHPVSPTAVAVGPEASPFTVTRDYDIPCDASHSSVAQPARPRSAGRFDGRRIGWVNSPRPNRASRRLKRERSNRSSAEGGVSEGSPSELVGGSDRAGKFGAGG
jgi:hypothetical protein